MSVDVSEFTTRVSLLLQLRDLHDRDAWSAFVDAYGPLVYGHCRRRGLQHADAEDVTQKVFAIVAQAISTFDYQPSIGRFRDWLGTVVHNEVCRFLKSEIGAVRGRGEADESSFLNCVPSSIQDTAWADDFNTWILARALEKIRPSFERDTWRGFELVWLESRPAQDVARELGQTIDWVYVAKSRVLKHLWQEVQELADDCVLGVR